MMDSMDVIGINFNRLIMDKSFNQWQPYAVMHLPPKNYCRDVYFNIVKNSTHFLVVAVND